MGKGQSKEEGAVPKVKRGELTAEEIRAQRLRKLEEDAPKILDDDHQPPLATNKPEETSNKVEEISTNAEKIQSAPVVTKPKSPEKPPVTKVVSEEVKKEYTKEQMMNDTLEILLDCSFDEARALAFNRKHLHVPLETSDSKYLSIANYDEVLQSLLAIGNNYYSSEEKIKFLCETINRLMRISNTNELQESDKQAILSITVSYLVSYLSVPELFAEDIVAEKENYPLDMCNILYEHIYNFLSVADQDFLVIFFKEVNDDDIKKFCTALFKRMLRDMNEAKLTTSKKTIRCLEFLKFLMISDQRIITQFITHNLFIPQYEGAFGAMLQKQTLIGAALNIVSLPQESNVFSEYFKDKLALRAAENTMKMLTEKIHDVVDEVHQIFEILIKSGDQGKKAVSNFFSEVLRVNEDKKKMYNNPMMNNTCTNGWFANFVLLLMKMLNKGIIDKVTEYPKRFAQVDVNFLKEVKLFNGTYLCNGQNVTNQNGQATTNFNLVTQLIFFTNHALQLHNTCYKQYVRLMEELSKEQQANPTSPKFLSMLAAKFASDVQLMDPYLIQSIFKLFSFDALYILHNREVPVTEMNDISSVFMNITKAKHEGDKVGAIPVYWCENIAEYSITFRRVAPQQLAKIGVPLEVLVDFMFTLMGNSEWLPNPHVRAQYLEFMGMLLPPRNAAAKDDNLSHLLRDNPFLDAHVVMYLVNVFNDCEKTGGHNQFYDKFRYRHGFCMVINYLLKRKNRSEEKSHLIQQFEDLSLNKVETFIAFINFLINDITYMLDDTLGKVRDIKKYEDEAETEQFATLPEEEKNMRRQHYEGAKNFVKNFLFILIEYYHVIVTITTATQKPFMRMEIKEKLITNLNYTINELNGPGSKNINVKNKKDVGFDPRTIMECVMQVYLNFEGYQEFIEEVARDSRSFSVEVFEKTRDILLNKQMITEEDAAKFTSMIQEVKKILDKNQIEDDFIKEIGEIPEEFMDPLLGDIMQDPVLLPTSGNIVERLSITKHLLNDPIDPYNRKPLTKEMLIPQTELKEKIEKFFAEKRKEKENKL
jgi:hypothetical protein